MRLARQILYATLLAPVPLCAQQDGLVAYPDVYRVQFENDYVRLVRVRLPGSAQLAEHTHPPGIMLHVYFNAADPVQFNHDGPPNDVTRPAVAARSYRVGPATPETHAVINTGPGMSDYMRIELKTTGDARWRTRVPALPLVDSTSTVVDVETPQYRSSRITMAKASTLDLAATASRPFVLIALTDGIGVERPGEGAHSLKTGDEHFAAAGERATLRNVGTTPVQLLRVDFLTGPMK